MRGVFVEALRFGLVGLANTTLSVAVIFGAMSWLGTPPLWANLAGYVIGLMISFVLNALWTFRSPVTWRGAVRFLGVFAVSYTTNLGVLIAAMHGGADHYLSQTLAIASYTVAFFTLSKLFVFVARAPHTTDNLVL